MASADWIFWVAVGLVCWHPTVWTRSWSVRRLASWKQLAICSNWAHQYARHGRHILSYPGCCGLTTRATSQRQRTLSAQLDLLRVGGIGFGSPEQGADRAGFAGYHANYLLHIAA